MTNVQLWFSNISIIFSSSSMSSLCFPPLWNVLLRVCKASLGCHVYEQLFILALPFEADRRLLFHPFLHLRIYLHFQAWKMALALPKISPPSTTGCQFPIRCMHTQQHQFTLGLPNETKTFSALINLFMWLADSTMCFIDSPQRFFFFLLAHVSRAHFTAFIIKENCQIGTCKHAY